MSMPLLSVKNISKQFEKSADKVLDGLSFSVDQGKVVAIVGASGAGKTTALKVISGLLPSSEGVVEMVGVNYPGNKSVKNYGLVFQEDALYPHLSARENLIFGRAERREELFKQADQLLVEMGIFECSDHLPTEMSGGQQQRLAIARSLMGKPRILLLDEPFANLDQVRRTGIIHELKKRIGKDIEAMIFVSHHIGDVLMFADEVVVMEGGRCVQQGLIQDVYHKPKSLAVARLLGEVNQVVGEDAQILTASKDDGLLLVRPENLCPSEEGLSVQVEDVYFGQGVTWVDCRTSNGSHLKVQLNGWVDKVEFSYLEISGPIHWI